MSAPVVFEYALVRVVPRVERGEQFNAGVLFYCRPAGLVRAEIRLDEAGFATADSVREAYLAQLAGRAAGPRDWLPEVAA